MEQKKSPILWYLSGFLIIIAIIIVWMALSTPPTTDTKDAQTNAETRKDDASATAGESLSPTSVKDTPSQPIKTFENGVFVTSVIYTGNSFEPQIITINRGEEVRFINKSNLSMRIVSNQNEGSPILLSLNQPQSVGRNGTHQIPITEAGVWNYRNLDNPTNPGVIGIIYVK